MTLPDDYVDEMIALHQIDDATAEALLAGRAVSDDLRPLAEVVQAYRRLAHHPVRPSPALARQISDGFFTGVAERYQRPAMGAGPRRPRWSLARAAWVAVVGGVAAALAGVSTAGFAGVLPDQAQDRFETVVETVVPYKFPAQADENADFGEEVGEDATDGGVDGDEISERAREQGTDRRPDDLPTAVPEQPGPPSDPPAPAGPNPQIPVDPGRGNIPTPPTDDRRPTAPPGR